MPLHSLTLDRHTLEWSLSFNAMSSDQFYLFAALAAFSQEIQDKLRKVQTPEAIIALASDHGYDITLQQLSYYAHRLNGDHWIWVHKGDTWRERFFASERQLDLQASGAA